MKLHNDNLTALKNGFDLQPIINEYELAGGFSKKVKNNAEEVCFISKRDYENRRNLCDELIFTIDGEDSRDFDDAVSIKKIYNGYSLGVHIADVSHYVKKDSFLDKEAFKRGTSVYFPFSVIPMLPKNLSDDICSLIEGSDRLTLSVIMDIDSNGRVFNYEIFESVINSKKRFTYKKVQNILDRIEVEDKNLTDSLFLMRQLAEILLSKRIKNGAIDFDSIEPEFEFASERAVGVKKKEILFSHKLIEEFMILANETVARHFYKKGVPFVYRVHAEPSYEKRERLCEFLSTMGIDAEFLGEISSKDYADLLKNSDISIRRVLSKVLLRSMSKAEYLERNGGHFGLNLANYCHFTSPIRRYPDLVIHRIIKEVIKGQSVKKYRQFVEIASYQSSVRERQAEEAERKVNSFLIAFIYKDKIGQKYSGFISGVTDFGVFVELEDTAEGLIRIENLNGQYVFDCRANILKGEKTFRLGDKLDISVLAVRGNKIEFTLA